MNYYVNKYAQSNGDHEVHNESCPFLPSVANRTHLGDFTNCRDAVTKAKTIYRTADGCATCSPTCHKR